MQRVTLNQAIKWWGNSRAGNLVYVDKAGRRCMWASRLYQLIMRARELKALGYAPQIKVSANGKWYEIARWEQ